MNKLNKRVIQPRRQMTDMFPTQALCLPAIPRAPQNWKTVLDSLCDLFNRYHGSKMKCCSITTSEQRRNFLFRFFETVQTFSAIDPRDLKRRHIAAFFKLSVARARTEGRSERHIRSQVINEVSFLRFFELWIGKPGLTESVPRILARCGLEPEKAPKSPVRGASLSEDAALEVIEKAFARDMDIGCAVLAMVAFGLQPLEACALKPLEQFDRGGTTLEIPPAQGSKGGRPRSIPISEPFQCFVRDYLRAYAETTPENTLSAKAETPLQFKARLAREASESLKLSRTLESGSLYGFRHRFAQRLVHRLIGKLAASGARQETSYALGHARLGVTGVYMGCTGPVSPETMRLLAKLLLKEREPAAFEEALTTFLRSLIYIDTELGALLTLACLRFDEATLESDEGQSAVFALKSLGPSPLTQEVLSRVEYLFSKFLALDTQERNAFMEKCASSLHFEVVNREILRPFLKKFLKL